jgi:hypothetical protein
VSDAGAMDHLSDMSRDELQSLLSRLQTELDERRRALPAHSIRPHQLVEIEELEDEIAEIREHLARVSGGDKAGE